MSVSRFFAQSYAEARQKFLQAAQDCGLDPVAHAHPLLGRDGELLAMDVARFGAADAQALLIISSACHGVEGYLRLGRAERAAGRPRLACRGRTRGRGRALHPRTQSLRLFVAAPHHARERRPEPQLPGLFPAAAAQRGLRPAGAPARAGHLAADARSQGRPGRVRRRARPEGACRPPSRAGSTSIRKGLFYGGRNPTWSHQTLRHVLRDHGRRCARLGWIDLHTGLGPSGHG